MADDLLDTIRQGSLNALRSSNDLVKYIVSEAVCFPNEFKWAGLGKHILDIFEEELAAEVHGSSECSSPSDVLPVNSIII